MKDETSEQNRLQFRLALIKRRHQELILKPRETIAADLSSELDDPYDEVLGADQLELAEAMDPVRS